jgi:hypothetical protein
VVGTTLVFVEESLGVVATCPTTGCPTGGPTPLATVFEEPEVLQSDGNTVFWIDDLNGVIQSCPVTGCATPTTIVTIANNKGAYSIPLAVDATSVYWLDSAGNVASCPSTGCVGPATTLATAQGAGYGIAVDDAAVYWTSLSLGYVAKVAKP